MPRVIARLHLGDRNCEIAQLTFDGLNTARTCLDSLTHDAIVVDRHVDESYCTFRRYQHA